MQHAQRSTTQYNWFNSCNLIRYKTRQYTTAQHNTTQCFQDIVMVCHHWLSPLSCRTSLIRVHVYASMQRFRDFEEANPLSLPSTPSGTSLRLESALVQCRLKASPRWHSKGWFFCFLERNSNFWSPQHDWKTKIIWNWSPTYSNLRWLEPFFSAPSDVSWGKATWPRTNGTTFVLECEPSCPNTCSWIFGIYSPGGTRWGIGCVFFCFFAEVAAKFLYTQTHEQWKKQLVTFGRKGSYCYIALGCRYCNSQL